MARSVQSSKGGSGKDLGRYWHDSEQVSHYFERSKKLGSVDHIHGQGYEAILFDPAGRKHHPAQSLNHGKTMVEAFWKNRSSLSEHDKDEFAKCVKDIKRLVKSD